MGACAALCTALAITVLTHSASWGILAFGLSLFFLVLAGRDPAHP